MVKAYGPDYRLSARIARHSWPLLDVRMSGNAAKQDHVHAYCNQMYQISTDLENIGAVAITGVCIATDHPELVSLSELSKDNAWEKKWILAPAELFTGNVGILVQKLSYGRIECGQKTR